MIKEKLGDEPELLVNKHFDKVREFFDLMKERVVGESAFLKQVKLLKEGDKHLFR